MPTIGENSPPTPPPEGSIWPDQEPPLMRWWTRRHRLLPDFLILGGQRCGTTSLHRQLMRCPGLALAPAKEVHYFDLQYGRGSDWYRAHFPLAIRRHLAERMFGSPLLIGETTPYYLFHPCVPERVRQELPEARLIVMLRNPVDRAYSHYHHVVRYRCEDAPTFAEALDREERRLEGEETRLLMNADYRSVSHCHHSYLARGIYVRQLRAWHRFFPREQILVLRSEDLFSSPETTLARILEFVGALARQPRGLPHLNRAENPRMPEQIRERLVSFFRPHNRELEEYLGTELGWDG